MFYSSSWIFLKFKWQAILRVTDQCQDRPSTLQHLSENVLFFTISWAQRHLGLCVNVS